MAGGARTTVTLAWLPPPGVKPKPASADAATRRSCRSHPGWRSTAPCGLRMRCPGRFTSRKVAPVALPRACCA
eukprot:9799352-Lingulodinium_polyedra.AAC.1